MVTRLREVSKIHSDGGGERKAINHEARPYIYRNLMAAMAAMAGRQEYNYSEHDKDGVTSET